MLTFRDFNPSTELIFFYYFIILSVDIIVVVIIFYCDVSCVFYTKEP